MSEHEKEELDDESVAREAKKFLSRHDWQLISTEELAGHVTSLLTEGPFTDAYWACYHVYSEVLYRVCIAVEQPERQELGWTELSQHLFNVVCRYAPEFSYDKRKEVMDQALAETYYHLAEVRNPNAFLTVATQHARNIIRAWRRDMRVNSGTLGEDQAAPNTSMPDQRYTDTELRQRLQECFKRALLRHPRAKTQLRVVWMKQIEGWDYPAIATALNRKVGTVRVLHTRGLERLRNDPDWRRLGQDY
jgi:RNA polymerase sigma factor (sigma-70 family)